MAELSAVFKKAPKEAVRFLGEKRNQPSDDWEAVSAQTHQHAFTVAQTAGFDLLGDIKSAIEQARGQGWTHEQFQDHLRPMLRAKGWWGQAVDQETGEILKTYPGASRPVRYGTPARLRLIYDTNMDKSGIQVEASGGEFVERQVPVNSGRDLLTVAAGRRQMELQARGIKVNTAAPSWTPPSLVRPAPPRTPRRPETPKCTRHARGRAVVFRSGLSV